MVRPNKFNGMMHEFCVGLGFCGSVKDGKPLHVTQFIPEQGQVTAAEFVRWLLIADCMDPEDSRWTNELKAVFVKHMGRDAVDANELHSEYRGT